MNIRQEESYVDFVLIHEGGSTKIVVENGPTINCSDLPTDKVIQKIMSLNITGFGTPVATDHGHTPQYYDEQAKNNSQEQEYTEPPEETKPVIQRRREHDQQARQYDL